MAEPVVKEQVKRILIIDRDPIVQFYQKHLAEAGHIAIVTSKGQDGILEAIAFHPDVIFIDPDLPNENGYEIIGGLRALPGMRGVPIVVLTHTDEERIIEKSLKAGADDILFKKDMIPNEVLAKAIGILQAMSETITLAGSNLTVNPPAHHESSMYTPTPPTPPAVVSVEKIKTPFQPIKVVPETKSEKAQHAGHRVVARGEEAIQSIEDSRDKFKGATVLMIDEDPFFVRTYKTKLEMDGYVTSSETNLEHLAETIRKFNPRVIVNTLYFSGLNLTEEHKKEGLLKDRALILLTASSEDCKSPRVQALKGLCFEKSAITPAILSSAIVAALEDSERNAAEIAREETA